MLGPSNSADAPAIAWGDHRGITVSFLSSGCRVNAGMDLGAENRVEQGPPLRPTSEPVAGGLLQFGAEFIGNAGITLFGSVAGALLTMASEVLAARILGVAGYGLYALAIMLARVSAVIVLMGVSVSILHYLPIHLNRKDMERALGTILGALPLPLAMGLTLALSLGIGGNWIAAHLLGQPRAGPFLAVLAFAIPLLVTIDLLGAVARAFNRALFPVFVQNIAPQLCAIPVLIWLLLYDGPKIDVAYGQLIGALVGASLAIWFVVRLVRRQIGSTKPAFELARLYGYALPITLNVMATLVMGFTDLYLLGLLTDPSTVGTYRACVQIVLFCGLPMVALRAATAPIYTVLIAEGRRALLQDTYGAAVRLATLAAVPLLMIIFVNGSDLLRVMGPPFAAGALALQLLAFGQCLEAAFSPAHVVLMIGGRQRLEAANMAMTAGLNLVLNLALIPVYGLLGAALSTTTSLVVLAILRGFQVRRILALRTIEPALLRIALISILPTLFVWAASEVLGFGPGSGLGPLLLRLAMMSVLIGGALWLFCLKAQDRETILRLLHWRRPQPAPTPDESP